MRTMWIGSIIVAPVPYPIRGRPCKHRAAPASWRGLQRHIARIGSRARPVLGARVTEDGLPYDWVIWTRKGICPMAQPASTAAGSRLGNISKYVYGTTRLGDEDIPMADRVKEIARAAMDAGVWFHTSHQYGNALRVLRTA